MRHASRLFTLIAGALPGAALAHAGHAPLSGLPDLLLHYPWTVLPVLAIGGLGLYRLFGRRLRARSRRR
ncbi:hypothetical protein [Immundisolibacter sp.]|uniref:hypothetical protein n=1 Tax=Immundisolibacter sp. TaxID=1934948 RepID=UPI000EE90073|nr:hypothetical protein [Gammaproteobacteria bacterium]